MVRAIEAAHDDDATLTLSAHLRRPGDAFLAMPYEAALEWFRSRRIMDEADFDALEDRYKRGGFVARDLAGDRMEQVAHDLILRLLDQGLTLDEVERQLRDSESEAARALGISPASSDYLDNVIRTNVATSYGAGRWAAMNAPEVVALRPYQQYRTAHDSRVRESHRLLDGRVFRAGSDVAAYYAPPLGFRCRCVMVTLSQRQFDARGLVLTEDRIDGVEPDDGWEGAPQPLA